MGFRNEYVGYTLKPALKQHQRLTGKQAKRAPVDRGYQDKSKIGETEIAIPKSLYSKKLSVQKQMKLRKGFNRRSGIETVISHLKSDYRLGRNFYNGIFGDNINIMLAAAAFNFKRIYNKYKIALLTLFFKWIKNFELTPIKIIALMNHSKSTNNKILKLKWAF